MPAMSQLGADGEASKNKTNPTTRAMAYTCIWCALPLMLKKLKMEAYPPETTDNTQKTISTVRFKDKIVNLVTNSSAQCASYCRPNNFA